MDEDDLARYPNLFLREGVWWIRKRVPADLRHVDQRWQVRRSLRTGEKRVALREYPARLAEIEAEFDRLRSDLARQGRVASSLKTGKLERLSRREIEGLVLRWWADRAEVRAPEITDDSDDDVLAGIDDAVASPPDLEPARRMADRLLVDAGAAAYPHVVGSIRTATLYPAVDRSTPQYQYLEQLVGRALTVEAELAKDHLLGRRTAEFDPLFNQGGDHRTGHVAGPGATLRTVRDLIAEYRAERERLHGQESTERKYGLLFRVMEEVLGSDLRVPEIGRAQCVAVLAFLEKLPPHAAKRFPKLTLRQAVAKAEKDGLRGLAPKSVTSYLQNLGAILRWAEEGGWGVKTNLRNLNQTRKANVRRRGFRPDELKRLFDALETFRKSEPTKFWVPALALYTGARAGELCQLRAEDVVAVDGVSCLNLTEFNARGERQADKSLKTAASERYVPIHTALTDTGFLDFVKSRQADVRLFPDLPPGPNGRYSHDFSKRFGRFKKTVGFDEPALVFHSFRHGFRDACRDADIDGDTARALGGWAGINQDARYGDRSAVPHLNRAIKKLKFGDFALPPRPPS